MPSPPVEPVSAPSQRGRARLVTCAAFGALTALKLWFTSAQLMGAIVPAGYDDGLYLTLAHHLIRGEWLGPYTVVTLLKPPGYPLWIAANSFTGLPLHVTEQLAYAAACALFVSAVGPFLRARGLGIALFGILLFQPMSYSTSTLRYVRDSLYATQVLAFVACLIGLVWAMGRPARVVWRWSLGLGLVGGFMWITRDEGIVLTPAIGAALLLIGASLRRHRPADWRSKLAAIAVALPIAAGFLFGVAAVNQRHYGFFGVSEFRSTELSDALGALARIRPASHTRWVIVSRETRERAYLQAPAFRELQPFLEGHLDVWAAAGPLMYDWDQRVVRAERATGRVLDAVCQETVPWDDAAMRAEIMTGWFVLALREAVALAGHATAPASLQQLSRVAADVNAACEAGRLECDPRRSSLAPPWRWQDLGLTLRRGCRGTARLLTLEDLPFFGTHGTDEQVATVQEDTHDRLAPRAGTLTFDVTGVAPVTTALDRWRLDTLAGWHSLSAAITPWFALVAVAGLVLALIRLSATACGLLAGTLAIILLAVGARVALLAYMDATAFPLAIMALYLMPVYPLMFAAFTLATIAGVRALRGAGDWKPRWAAFRVSARPSADGA